MLRILLKHAIFIATFCILISCTADNKASITYRQIGAKLNKQYKLTNSDLIITYDLGRLNNSGYIYAADLGAILNDEKYKKEYVSKFKSNFRSSENIRKTSLNKIIRIYKLLAKLHLKHKILTNNEYQYIKRLQKSDVTKMDARHELSKLDKIIKNIPIMLPEHNTRISSHYGKRKHPVTKKRKFHCGIDLYSSTAAPIYSSAEGRVVFAGKRNGYGNIVEIYHGRGMKTKYAHLKNIIVKKGQKVTRGQIIGRQGRTGRVTSEHLHYEIWIHNKHINPYDFISCECNSKK